MDDESSAGVIFPFYIPTGTNNSTPPQVKDNAAMIRGVECVLKEYLFDVPLFDEAGLVHGKIFYWQPAILEHDIMERGIRLVKNGIGLDAEN